jgi:hypothetical protein
VSPTATAPARTRGGAAAPARPRHQPAPAPVRRHLRPVPDAPSRAARPRRRVRPQAALMIALLAFFLILFGVALLQTVLVQGQLHLDGLRADLSERQVQAQIDRDEVARAESPEALISAAEAQGFTPSDPIFTPAIPEAGAAAP